MKNYLKQRGFLVNTTASPTYVEVKVFDSDSDYYLLNDGTSLYEVPAEQMYQQFIPGESINFITTSSDANKVYIGEVYLSEDDEENPFRSSAYQTPVDTTLLLDEEKLDVALSKDKMYVGDHTTIIEAARELVNEDMFKHLKDNIFQVSSHKEAVDLYKSNKHGFIGYIVVPQPTWVLTDEGANDYRQYVKQIDHFNYEVLEIIPLPDGIGEKFVSKYIEIDIESEMKNQKDVLDILKTFGYESIQKVKDIYGDENANWIIAECIAEMEHFSTADKSESLKDESEVQAFLKEHGIKQEKRIDIVALPQRNYLCSECKQVSSANEWNEQTSAHYPDNNATLPENYDISDDIVFKCPSCQHGTVSTEIAEVDSNGDIILPKPRHIVYQETEGRLKTIFEQHIKKQTGVDVELYLICDSGTNRLYIQLEKEIDDVRFTSKYNAEEWADFATQLCNEVFADGEDLCYPEFLSEQSEYVEIFVAITDKNRL